MDMLNSILEETFVRALAEQCPDLLAAIRLALRQGACKEILLERCRAAGAEGLLLNLVENVLEAKAAMSKLPMGAGDFFSSAYGTDKPCGWS